MENQETLTLCAVGDVGVRFPKDPDKVFRCFDLSASILQRADIAFCQLERILSSNQEAAYHLETVDPAKYPMAKAMANAGFNVVSAAGNHHMMAGIAACIDTINNLKENNIIPVGVGMNITEARTPAIIERKGVRVAFLGYSSIIPRSEVPYEATSKTPGCAPIYISTFYEPEDWQPGHIPTVVTRARKEDLAAMVQDIRRVKAQADVVIMSIHWGLRNIPAVIADYQYEVGHAAIDAGVDLILGHHAHILKGIEVYKGKVVFHCLGNFCMHRRTTDKGIGTDDRWGSYVPGSDGRPTPFHPIYVSEPEWQDYTLPPDFRKTMIAKCTISAKSKTIEKVSYIPCMLNQNIQAEPLLRGDKRSDEVYQYVEWAGKDQGMDTRFSREGDEVVVIT